MNTFLRSTFLASATLIGLSLVGCSSSSSSGSSSSDFVAQYCQLYMTCCQKAGLPTDGAQCRAFLGAFVGSIDSTKANACLAEMRAASTKADFCPSGGSKADTPSCQGLTSSGSGTAKPGDSCTQDGDCAPATAGTVRCASTFSSSGTTEYCQVQVVGKEGDTCGQTIDGNATISTGSSSGPQPTVTSCDTKDGIYCASGTGGAAGKCTKISDVGGACSGSSYSCKKGLTCDFGTSTCKALPAIGEACTFDCATGAYCDTPSGASGGTCKATVAEGADCTSNSMCATNNCTNKKCAKASDFTSSLLCGK